MHQRVPKGNSDQSWLLRPWDTGLCALKLTLHHAVGEGHKIALARRRKLNDCPSDLLSAFVVIRRKPKNKRGGGKCLIHNFDVFGLEGCSPQESDYFHKVVPELPGNIWVMYGRRPRCKRNLTISEAFGCGHVFGL
jgi:hypothetical protein